MSGNIFQKVINDPADLSQDEIVTGVWTFSNGLILGNTAVAAAGKIRWDGSNFQGYDGSAWVNLDNDLGSGSNEIITGDWTFDGLFKWGDTSLDHDYIIGVSELTADRTITLPLLTGNDIFVFNDFAAILQNKTIDADNNTITNLAHGAEVDEPSSGVHGVAGSLVGTTDAQILSAKVLTLPEINDTSLDHQYIFAVSELTADRIVTLPLLTGNDIFTFNDFAAILQNKTIDTANNTLTIAEADITDGTLLARVGSAETITGTWVHNYAAVFNSGGENLDFQIKGENVDNLFHLDASADGVGIGRAASGTRFEVEGLDDAGAVTRIKNTSTNANANVLTLLIDVPAANTANDYITFIDAGGTIGRIEGNGTGVDYVTTSDSRHKKNIVDMDSALAIVRNMQPRKFEPALGGTVRTGFIAQELAAVFPDAVSGSPEDGVVEKPMGVDYGKITPLLTKAIQELDSEIAKMKVDLGI